MRIRTHKPWYVRLPLYGLLLISLFVVGKALYGAGQRITGHENLVKHIAQLEERVLSLTAERDMLSGRVDASVSKLSIEQATQKKMVDQVRALTLENNRLKEDLGFYEGMLPSQGDGLGVRSVRFTPEAPNQWHFRVLLMQTGKVEEDIQGQMQIALTYVLDGKNAMMVLPAVAASGSKSDQKPPADTVSYRVNLKRFQKLEGMFNLPDGAVLKMAQVRVLVRGQIKAQHSTNF